MNVSASVVGRFPVPDSGSGLSIEPDLDPYSDGLIHLLLFPSDPDINVYASVGDVILGSTKSVTMPAGIVQFSGSSTSNLPHKPFETAPEFTVLFAFDADGIPTTVTVRYDGSTNVLTASQDCYAAVKYTSYQAGARRLAYRPLSRPFAGGVSLEFGVIAAFKPPKGPMVIYEVQPFSIVNGNAVYELYRIVSQTVTTPDGEYEKPWNYPTNPGRYKIPNVSPLNPGDVVNAFELDVSVSMLTKRTHEIGFMDETGRGWVNSYFVPAIAPFVGDNNYVIPKTVEVATVTQFPENIRLKALDFIRSRGLGVV